MQPIIIIDNNCHYEVGRVWHTGDKVLVIKVTKCYSDTSYLTPTQPPW